jgi:hypothetical protein
LWLRGEPATVGDVDAVIEPGELLTQIVWVKES